MKLIEANDVTVLYSTVDSQLTVISDSGVLFVS